MKQHYYLSQERPNHNLGRFSPGITGGFPRQENIDYGNDIQSECYSEIFKIRGDITGIERPLKVRRSVISAKEGRLLSQGNETFICLKKFRDKNVEKRIELPNRKFKEESIKDEANQNELEFYSPEEIHKHIRRRKLTKREINKAMSIVGIIKDEVESDLSNRFREYLSEE